MNFSIDHAIKSHLIKVLTHTKGNRTHAARLLGISIRTLRHWMHRYDLMFQFQAKYGTESHEVNLKD